MSILSLCYHLTDGIWETGDTSRIFDCINLVGSKLYIKTKNMNNLHKLYNQVKLFFVYLTLSDLSLIQILFYIS